MIPLDDEDLDALLSAHAGPSESELSAERYLRFIRECQRDEELRRRLQLEIGLKGPRAFIIETVAPLITLVGRTWADGGLEIRHEHFLTEILEDQLHGIRESVPPVDDAPVVLFATLPEESHGLGLQMAAAFAALAGARASILGIDVPIAEIVAAAGDARAVAVCVSVSLARAGVATDRELAKLRSSLPDDIHLVVGGRGSRGPRRGPRDVIYFESLAPSA